MASSEIVRQRLANQGVLGSGFTRAADVAAHLVAVQSQDYRGGLWGLGLRTQAATEADVEQAIADRAVVRTWPMRGTLHFVAAGDVRWMLELLAGRVITRAAGRHRQLGLAAADFARAEKAAVRALQGDRRLTREELFDVFARAEVSPAGQRGIHVLGVLAMRGVLCFGPRRGKQPTLALLDEWVPPARARARDEALGELAQRYFTGHGPATIQDFAWWSGLPLGDARAGIALARAALHERAIAEHTYWGPRAEAHAVGRATTVQLLPPWDEYTVAYRDRSAFLDPAHAARAGNGISSPVILVDGHVAGTWKRAEKKARTVITTEFIAPLARGARRALAHAVERYGRFVGRAATLAE